jgi:hypothetical protein
MKQSERIVEGHFRVLTKKPVLEAPIVIAFEYRNTNDHPVKFALGNSRQDGFRFITAAPGVISLNPYYEMGGLEQVIRLGPGETGHHDIVLDRYLQFTAPGEFVIDAEFDVLVRDEQFVIRAREQIRDRFKLSISHREN